MKLSFEQSILISKYSSKRQDFLFCIQMLVPPNVSHLIDITLTIKCSYCIPDNVSAQQAATDVILYCKSSATASEWIEKAKNINLY